MDFSAEPVGRYLRVIAIVALLLGLSDASRLLGVSLGTRSPIDVMGLPAFTFLATFTLALLFSAVGLWIKSSWGAVLLGGASAVELVLFLTGNQDVRMTIFGFGIRLVLLAAVLALFVFRWRARRAAQPD